LATVSSKSLRRYVPFTSSLDEALTGRVARRACLFLFLFLILLTAAVRLRSYVMVREFQRVLSGMSRIQIDKTTEKELVRLVPDLVRGTTTEKNGAHIERYYDLVLSNESDLLMHQMYFGSFGYWIPHERAIKIADWVGYRYINFYAQLLVIDGNVSRIRYEIADHPTIPGGLSNFISVRSAHGVWGQETPTVVTAVDDESPQFRVSGDEKSLHVTYMFDASPELASRAFDINLACFWSFRGCRAARDIAPLLWQYKNEMEGKSASRLVSGEPCPDRILAGRARYLPDLDVLLLDVAKVPKQLSVDEWGRSGKTPIGYGLREIIRGSMGASQEAKKIRYYPEIRASSNLSWQSENPLSRVPQLGDQVLLFSGALFQSCQMVSNIPSALSAIQKAVPVPRRREDEILGNKKI
jgi:hypothetical protein